ncbi:kinase-like domain-containing protein [Gigaspora rosea]|uniref:Kinase-like domain-containing protein n=1 Tax=Gigaspora rosea TaxID=44941 RepID=A0A397U3N7_9GLOM|nr:kinase-like domain-containing protein [Gigaspora rosea]
MRWKHKLKLLNYIISNLEAIHSQGYIHHDLHSGNILQDNLCSSHIADLNLCNYERKTNGVFGILPYIAPEILMSKPYTTKSDIYSFGKIMWETYMGYLYHMNVFSEQHLQVEICCSYLRPPVNEEAPQCYVNLMKVCWNKIPEKRPSAKTINESFIKWQNDKNILSELKNSKTTLKNIEKSYVETVSSKSKPVSYTGSVDSEQIGNKQIDNKQIYSEQIYSEQMYNDVDSKQIDLVINEEKLRS